MGVTVEMAKRAEASSAAAAISIDEAPQKDRTGVQSLERAFAILEEITRHPDGVSLGELAKQVGLHTSTTFHLVRTMVGLGYARQSAETKRYHIGRMLFALASGALTEVEIVGLATPLLEDLARRTGETAHLAIRSGEDLAVVARAAGQGAFQLVNRAGGVRPYHATALGKAVLAAMPQDNLDRYFEAAQLVSFTPTTTTDPAALRGEIERIRHGNGVAYDDGEYISEVRCIAAPVRDFTGRAIGSLGVSGPIWRISLQRLPEISEEVLRTAKDLSRDLGTRVV